MAATINNPGKLIERKTISDSSFSNIERFEYDSGAIIIVETSKLEDKQFVDCNYNWTIELDGSRSVKLDSPNTDFVDRK